MKPTNSPTQGQPNPRKIRVKKAGLFTVIRPYTVRFSEIENPTVRFGAVLRKRKSYGAVRCGFQILQILAPVHCDISYGAVRCGFEK